MYRIDNDTAAASLSSPTALGLPGYFQDGNPSSGIEATDVDAEWLNMVQEEISNVIEDSDAGNTALSKASRTQLKDSIKAMITAGVGGGGGSVIQLPMNRVAPQWVSNTQVKIPSGFKCVDTTGLVTLNFGSDATVSISSAGIANGLDAGAVAANTQYYLHAICQAGGANPAGLLSLSRTAPTLPSGYTKFRPLPVMWRTNASSQITNMYCVGGFPFAPSWLYNLYLEPFTDPTHRILNGVINTGFNVFDASTYVPPKSKTALVMVAQKNNFNYLAFSPDNVGGGIPQAFYDETRYLREVALNSSQQGYQKGSTGGTMYASVQGYRITEEFDS
jgi:hypothetical protein